MSGSFADRLFCRRAPLAFALCLLAFLFAVEAKTAMYGPEYGLGSDVRAAKAMPAVTPELVGHHTPTPGPLHPHTAFTDLSHATASIAQPTHLPHPTRVLRSQLPLFSAVFLSPQHFFRPPPAF